MSEATYKVPDANMDRLKTELEKLAKKATKLGLTPITMEVVGVEDIPYNINGDGVRTKATPEDVQYCKDHPSEGLRLVYFRFNTVVVKGKTPRLGGWSFVATLEHLQDEEGNIINMLRTVPGFKGQLPEKFRTATPENCDHCNKAIKTRKETFVVSHEDGSWKQVGRNCTQDFLGGLSPHSVTKGLEQWLYVGGLCSDAEGFGSNGGGYYEPRFDTLDFLTAVAAMIRVDGWVSRAKARASQGLTS